MAKKQDKSLIEKEKRGRKRLIKSPAEMQERAEQYFIECEEQGKSPNIAGLTLFLGFSHRTQIAQYYNDFPEYKEVIDYIKTYMESIQLENLENKEKATAGIIFNLKCNFGYNDRQQEESEKVNNMASALSAAMDIIKNQSMNNESSNH